MQWMRKLCGQRKRQDDPELLGRSTAVADTPNHEPGGVIAGDTDPRSSEDEYEEDLLRGFLNI
jgi:hypothetical protein